MTLIVIIPTGKEIFNRVLCAGSEQQYVIGCGFQEIIDIHSITVAYLPDVDKCNVDNLLPKIESIQPPCKRSMKTPSATDGAEVYRKYVAFCNTFCQWFILVVNFS